MKIQILCNSSQLFYINAMYSIIVMKIGRFS